MAAVVAATARAVAAPATLAAATAAVATVTVRGKGVESLMAHLRAYP